MRRPLPCLGNPVGKKKKKTGGLVMKILFHFYYYLSTPEMANEREESQFQQHTTHKTCFIFLPLRTVPASPIIDGSKRRRSARRSTPVFLIQLGVVPFEHRFRRNVWIARALIPCNH